jgi:hypothetical protein
VQEEEEAQEACLGGQEEAQEVQEEKEEAVEIASRTSLDPGRFNQ